MSTPSFALLPPEIWQNICSKVPDDRSRYGTLNNLSRASKFLLSIAQPLLWSIFSNRQRRHLVSFTKCVITYSELAKHVKDVEIMGYETENPVSGSNLHEAAEDGDLEYFLDEASKCKIFLSWISESDRQARGSNDEDSKRDGTSIIAFSNKYVRKGFGELLIKLLSVHLPNLQRLSVEACYRWSFERILNISDAEHGPSKLPFPNLQELYVQYWDEQDGFDLNDISALLTAPSLYIVHLYQVDKAPGKESPLSVNNSVKSLTFTASCLDDDQITRVISAFPNLESFEFHTGGAIVCDGGPDEFTPRQLVTALRPIVGRLKHFTLDMGHHAGLDYENQTFPIVSFKEFKVLRSLSIEQMSILTQCDEGGGLAEEREDMFNNFFPRTLDKLRLTHVYSNIKNPLQWLARNIKDQLPDLKELQLDLGQGEMSERYSQKMENIIDSQKARYAEDSNANLGGETDRAADDMEDGSYRPSWQEDRTDRYHSTSLLPESWQQILSNFTREGVSVKIGWVEEATYIKGMYKPPLESWKDCSMHEPYIESRRIGEGPGEIVIKRR